MSPHVCVQLMSGGGCGNQLGPSQLGPNQLGPMMNWIAHPNLCNRCDLKILQRTDTGCRHVVVVEGNQMGGNNAGPPNRTGFQDVLHS